MDIKTFFIVAAAAVVLVFVVKRINWRKVLVGNPNLEFEALESLLSTGDVSKRDISDTNVKIQLRCNEQSIIYSTVERKAQYEVLDVLVTGTRGLILTFTEGKLLSWKRPSGYLDTQFNNSQSAAAEELLKRVREYL